MSRIKRIGLEQKLVEGDFVEVAGLSEPLYLFTHGELVKITPQEYNYLHSKFDYPKNYGYLLDDFRRKEGTCS